MKLLKAKTNAININIFVYLFSTILKTSWAWYVVSEKVFVLKWKNKSQQFNFIIRQNHLLSKI